MWFLSGDSGTHCRVADGEGPKNAIIEDYTKKNDHSLLYVPFQVLGNNKKKLVTLIPTKEYN